MGQFSNLLVWSWVLGPTMSNIRCPIVPAAQGRITGHTITHRRLPIRKSTPAPGYCDASRMCNHCAQSPWIHHVRVDTAASPFAQAWAKGLDSKQIRFNRVQGSCFNFATAGCPQLQAITIGTTNVYCSVYLHLFISAGTTTNRVNLPSNEGKNPATIS